MPFIDDLVASNEIHGEQFNSDIEAISVMDRAAAEAMFPGVTLHDSEDICYFPFKLCHSLPKVNARGRAFTAPVLQNSFASLTDQLVDWDHLLKANNIGAESDRIIGHVKATKFSSSTKLDDSLASAIASATGTPMPVFGLAALYLRAEGVRAAVSKHLSGKEVWKTSMECGHSYKDSYLFYDGEFIPTMDAEIAMRDCVKPASVKDYKGKKLAICLGGVNGSVNFWGLAITKSPADADADILAFIGGTSRELASKKLFYMPLKESFFNSAEVASKGVDNIIHERTEQEIASIHIIGSTEPSEDGHTHEVLSDLTVVPYYGHSHSIYRPVLVTGTKPAVTGVTSEYTVYPRSDRYSDVSSGNSVSHMHLVNIPLNKKTKKSAEDTYELSHAEGKMMEKSLSDLLEQVNTLSARLVTASTNTAPENAALAAEVASIQKSLSQINEAELTKQQNESFLKLKIEAKELVTAEQANAMVTAAVDELKAKTAEEKRIADLKAGRIESCVTAGIDIAAILVPAVGDKKAVTLKDRIDSIPVDEQGELAFTLDKETWKKAYPKAAEVANKGAAAAATGQATASAGTTEEAAATEVANAGVPKHLMGRRALKKAAV